MRGENPEKYESDHRHFLYKQYLRILAVHQPAVFVLAGEGDDGLVRALALHQVGADRVEVLDRALKDAGVAPPEHAAAGSPNTPPAQTAK